MSRYFLFFCQFCVDLFCKYTLILSSNILIMFVVFCQGFSQDFEIECPKWYFYSFCEIIGCSVSIFSIVILKLYGVQKTGGWVSG